MHDLIEFLRLVPDTVWAALLAALLTLGGVILTNRGQNTRFLRQLDHDHQQRNRERQLRLKQDVFLAAAEGLAEMQHAISGMPDLNIEYSEIGNRFGRGSGAAQKIYVVATTKSVTALATYATDAGVTLLGLLAQRNPLVLRQSHIKWLTSEIEKSGAEKTRLVGMMREANLQGVTDQEQWNRMCRIFDQEMTRSEELSKERDAEFAQQVKELGEFLKLCFSEQQRLSELILPLLVAIREELELDVNLKALEDLAASLRPRAAQAIEDLVVLLNREFDNQRNNE